MGVVVFHGCNQLNGRVNVTLNHDRPNVKTRTLAARTMLAEFSKVFELVFPSDRDRRILGVALVQEVL